MASKTTVERTIRMSPVNVRLESQGFGPPVWRWQVNLKDPANGLAWELIRERGFVERIAPQDFGNLVTKMALEGVRFIFEPIPDDFRS